MWSNSRPTTFGHRPFLGAGGHEQQILLAVVEDAKVRLSGRSCQRPLAAPLGRAGRPRLLPTASRHRDEVLSLTFGNRDLRRRGVGAQCLMQGDRRAVPLAGRPGSPTSAPRPDRRRRQPTHSARRASAVPWPSPDGRRAATRRPPLPGRTACRGRRRTFRRRDYWASAMPASPAASSSRKARRSSAGTPKPLAYISPRKYWDGAKP